MPEAMREFASTLGFGAAGLFAGLGGRQLLVRLPRGTTVHKGWIALPVALLWALVGLSLGAGSLPTWWVPIPLALTWLAVLLAATDLRHRRLPDALTLPAYPAFATLIAIATIWAGWPLAAGAALGAVIFLGVHATVHHLRPHSLGAGDVKLSGSLGAVLGATSLSALILAPVLAALCTLALRLAGSRRFRTGTPHGPGLLAATTLLALFPAHL